MLCTWCAPGNEEAPPERGTEGSDQGFRGGRYRARTDDLYGVNLIEALQTATNSNKPHVTTTPDTPMLPPVAAFRPTAVPRRDSCRPRDEDVRGHKWAIRQALVDAVRFRRREQMRADSLELMSNDDDRAESRRVLAEMDELRAWWRPSTSRSSVGART